MYLVIAVAHCFYAGKSNIRKISGDAEFTVRALRIIEIPFFCDQFSYFAV